MFTRKDAVRDERIVAWQNKIGYEGYLVMTVILMASLLIKRVIYDVPVSSVRTETITLLAGAVYVSVRSVLTGTFTVGMQGKDQRSRRVKYYFILSGLAGAGAGLIMGIRNFLLYDFAAWKIILVVLPVTFFITPVLFALGLYLENKSIRRADALAGDDGEED